ncbi:MAG: hypothetical protein RJB55_1405, partial [Verrucomicrobiota bacterium]
MRLRNRFDLPSLLALALVPLLTPARAAESNRAAEET